MPNPAFHGRGWLCGLGAALCGLGSGASPPGAARIDPGYTASSGMKVSSSTAPYIAASSAASTMINNKSWGHQSVTGQQRGPSDVYGSRLPPRGTSAGTAGSWMLESMRDMTAGGSSVSDAAPPRELELLKGVSGFASPGRLMALMGGSGAGVLCCWAGSSADNMLRPCAALCCAL